MSEDRPRPQGRLDVDDIAALLRGDTPAAPPRVTERAIARVRVESTASVLLRTLGGSWLRVARAFGDLAVPRPPIERPEPPRTLRPDDLEDTGELPEADR